MGRRLRSNRRVGRVEMGKRLRSNRWVGRVEWVNDCEAIGGWWVDMGKRLRSNRGVGRVELLGRGGRGRRTTFPTDLTFWPCRCRGGGVASLAKHGQVHGQGCTAVSSQGASSSGRWSSIRRPICHRHSGHDDPFHYLKVGERRSGSRKVTRLAMESAFMPRQSVTEIAYHKKLPAFIYKYIVNSTLYMVFRWTRAGRKHASHWLLRLSQWNRRRSYER